MPIPDMAERVSHVTQKESSDGDSRHARVLKRTRGRQAQVKRLDDLRNYDSNGIRRHGKHHEHDEGERLDAGHALLPMLRYWNHRSTSAAADATGIFL